MILGWFRLTGGNQGLKEVTAADCSVESQGVLRVGVRADGFGGWVVGSRSEPVAG
jgi:hypothetical protein